MKYYITSYLLGIVTHSLWFDIDYTKVIAVVFFLVLVCSLFSFKSILRCVLCALFFLFGIYLFHLKLPDTLSLADVVDTKVQIQGKVVSEYIDQVNFKQFVVDIGDSERILVRTNSLAYVEYGDTLLLSGKLMLPESFETDSDRIFNYPMYLLKDNIFYLLSYTSILDIQTKELSLKDRFIRRLYENKELLIERANMRLPQPHAGLLAGILYGKKGSMNAEIDEQFRAVGLTHIVVLSGYNVSLVIQLFLIVLGFLPIRLRSTLAFLGIITFALLVGAGPTVVRASIMASLLVLSGLVHREYDVIRALIFAGVIMVSLNPYILLFDISFQLSFLATFSLIYVSPLIERYFQIVPNILEFRSSLVATISAQIFVLPLIFYQIGEFSVISIVVNTIVLFAVPFAMLFGAISSILSPGFILEICIFITFVFLEYIVKLVSYFSRYPLVHIPPFHISVLILIYLILFFVLYVKSDKV